MGNRSASPSRDALLYQRVAADIRQIASHKLGKSALGGKISNKVNQSWRMGWDSNPRGACTPGGFQDRCLQPLGHPSVLMQSVEAGAAVKGAFRVACSMRHFPRLRRPVCCDAPRPRRPFDVPSFGCEVRWPGGALRGSCRGRPVCHRSSSSPAPGSASQQKTRAKTGDDRRRGRPLRHASGGSTVDPTAQIQRRAVGVWTDNAGCRGRAGRT